MTARTSLPFVILTLALLAWVGVLERGRRVQPQRRGADAAPLTLDFSEVEWMEWSHHAVRIRLERLEGEWKVTEPFRFPANEGALALLVDEWGALGAPGAVLREAESPRVYGLEPAESSVRMGWADGETWSVSFGAEVPGESRRYASIDGEPWIRHAPPELSRWAMARPEDWKSRRFLTFAPDVVSAIEIENESGAIGLQRDTASGSWRVVTPIQEPAYGGQIRYWLGRLEQSPIRAFGEESAFVSVGIRARLRDDSGALVDWELGAPTEGTKSWIPVRRSSPGDIVYLDAPALGWLQRDASALRDPRLFDFDPAQVDRLEATTAQPFVLERDDTGGWWARDALGRYPASAARVRLSLEAMAFLEAERFVDVAASDAGLTSPQAVFQAFNADAQDAESAMLHIGLGRADGALFGATDDLDDVFLLAAGPLNPLTLSGFQYRQGRPFNWGPEEVTGAWIRRGQRERGLRRYENGEWDLAPPFGGVVRRFSTEETLTRLTRLESVEWLDRGAGAPKRFGIERIGWEIVFVLRSGAEAVLWIGGQAPGGGMYAATELDGLPWVFVIGPELAQRLQADFGLE